MTDGQYISLVPFNQIDLLTKPRDLIKGLVPNPGLTILYGQPKVGKSFVAFDMAMHVAMGRDYCGRRVMQGPVIYIAAEGEHGFRARVAAFRRFNMQGNV